MDRTARHTWVPWVAALAGAALTLKVLLILASGNALPDTPMAVLYLGGLLLGLAASVGVGLRQSGPLRSVGAGLGCALLLVLWILGLGEVLEPVVAVASDERYVQEEVPILLAGLVLLALAWTGRARDLRRVGVGPITA